MSNEAVGLPSKCRIVPLHKQSRLFEVQNQQKTTWSRKTSKSETTKQNSTEHASLGAARPETKSGNPAKEERRQGQGGKNEDSKQSQKARLKPVKGDGETRPSQSRKRTRRRPKKLSKKESKSVSERTTDTANDEACSEDAEPPCEEEKGSKDKLRRKRLVVKRSSLLPACSFDHTQCPNRIALRKTWPTVISSPGEQLVVVGDTCTKKTSCQSLRRDLTVSVLPCSLVAAIHTRSPVEPWYSCSTHDLHLSPCVDLGGRSATCLSVSQVRSILAVKSKKKERKALGKLSSEHSLGSSATLKKARYMLCRKKPTQTSSSLPVTRKQTEELKPVSPSPPERCHHGDAGSPTQGRPSVTGTSRTAFNWQMNAALVAHQPLLPKELDKQPVCGGENRKDLTIPKEYRYQFRLPGGYVPRTPQQNRSQSSNKPAVGDPSKPPDQTKKYNVISDSAVASAEAMSKSAVSQCAPCPESAVPVASAVDGRRGEHGSTGHTTHGACNTSVHTSGRSPLCPRPEVASGQPLTREDQPVVTSVRTPWPGVDSKKPQQKRDSMPTWKIVCVKVPGEEKTTFRLCRVCSREEITVDCQSAKQHGDGQPLQQGSHRSTSHGESPDPLNQNKTRNATSPHEHAQPGPDHAAAACAEEQKETRMYETDNSQRPGDTADAHGNAGKRASKDRSKTAGKQSRDAERSLSGIFRSLREKGCLVNNCSKCCGSGEDTCKKGQSSSRSSSGRQSQRTQMDFSAKSVKSVEGRRGQERSESPTKSPTTAEPDRWRGGPKMKYRQSPPSARSLGGRRHAQLEEEQQQFSSPVSPSPRRCCSSRSASPKKGSARLTNNSAVRKSAPFRDTPFETDPKKIELDIKLTLNRTKTEMEHYSQQADPPRSPRLTMPLRDQLDIGDTPEKSGEESTDQDGKASGRTTWRDCLFSSPMTRRKTSTRPSAEKQSAGDDKPRKSSGTRSKEAAQPGVAQAPRPVKDTNVNYNPMCLTNVAIPTGGDTWRSAVRYNTGHSPPASIINYNTKFSISLAIHQPFTAPDHRSTVGKRCTEPSLTTSVSSKSSRPGKAYHGPRAREKRAVVKEPLSMPTIQLLEGSNSDPRLASATSRSNLSNVRVKQVLRDSTVQRKRKQQNVTVLKPVGDYLCKLSEGGLHKIFDKYRTE